MPYPRKLLNDGETVAVDLHPHWFHFAEPVASLVGSIALGIVSLFFSGTLRTVLGWLAIVLIVATAIWTIVRYVSWATSHFVVSNDRIIYLSGWIRKRGVDIPLDRVNNVIIEQSVIERALSAGDLLIESAGESGQQRFNDIKRPERVKNVIATQIRDHKAGAGAAARPSTDVADQLERLEAMVERGSLTP